MALQRTTATVPNFVQKEPDVVRNKDIRQAVEAELSFDPLIDDSDVVVANMGGDIALNGTVATYPQCLAASAAARRVDGVRKVHNHLEVVLYDSDYRDDPTLTTTANNALAFTVTVPDGVEAQAKNGNVKLTGTVSNEAQRRSAEAAVSCLLGVRKVNNEIDVWSDVDPGDVVGRVQEALYRNAMFLDDSDVIVDTEDRTVSLLGHVRTWAEHDAALDAAWRTAGVYAVRDNLVITG